MSSSRDRIEALVERPTESLAIELKGWIDPSEPDGVAKIAKACIALRNQNGGYLLIGFGNDDGVPDVASARPDVATKFHADVVQGIVSKYASEAFEAHVHLVEWEGTTFPIIEVEAGVRTPVAAKRALPLPGGGRPLVREHAVYVRSLEANGTVSTTEAKWRDWPRIVEICFENREADVGRFIRRHLSNLTPDAVRAFAEGFQVTEPDPGAEELARSLLDVGYERFNDRRSQRGLELPPFGAMEVAAVVSGEVLEHGANETFLRLLDASNPGYTGWPVWIDSRGFRDQDTHPNVLDGAWEAFIWSTQQFYSQHIDFWRLDPRGRFYLLRALQDDLERDKLEALKHLDFGLVVLRVAEAIAVALEFARAMGASPEGDDGAQVAFAFRWRGLENRVLSSWANAGRYISPGRRCMQNEVVAEISVPLDTPSSAISGYVSRVVAKVFILFEGFELSENVVEDLVERLLNRRL